MAKQLQKNFDCVVVNSEILKGIKSMFGLFEHFHKSFAHVQANSDLLFYHVDTDQKVSTMIFQKETEIDYDVLYD